MPRHKVEDPNWAKAMRLYNNQCALCGTEFGVTIHEITPKSLAPKTWMDLNNRIALCAVHHEYVHTLPQKDREALLFPARDRVLKSTRHM